ncbi:D-alanyl-D-alanine carboxypeptidase [Halalkalibacterium halodurans]|uniref:D-alanyl-D-alanine carboxypeptidase (Penicillin-binding protein 5) n=1 Tax=Halalkalibacterium halodurans (strain ATCC BAA-125 / DSM 18197 / FERM 7344 / JCM 9153 / C-125) TaxID=272558 RepID=Q9K8X5_HALH5|nr:D-alanyl-D-alanine carboxypeptidase family protein [Halalkalibacterium halodurans]MDY7223430.1 D-alanyl-D-alanine carboxypeptidase family protein [Halalkalibacterium halodurans]MDY7242651.1 D-alanyl-D-alanine carboxypeptidase family protein [Halalkalibacterium halodurans]MED4081642.1 D-alanyl-D-alanine carboxypeptidase [Halalkalibacterium halodurans]MED4085195.1 D-alanyl-D-alanine carboxypeptidase [Halalkalibacterium halodurans]MED4104167.1 D-alanyl-D-alanine carboxypeptidase [Halalkalibact
MRHLFRVFILLFLFFVSLQFSVQTNASAFVSEGETLNDAHFHLNSESVLLMDQLSGQVLYSEHGDKKMYPASITKIITALIAIEEGDLDDIVTVSKTATEVIGTRVYLVEGEEVTLRKLVQGLMINSGNDAGTAIAEHFDGNEEAFAERMNRFVQVKIGVENTHFTNPHGLFDKEHYTTAYDMAMITKYAMENEKFRDVASTKELEWIGEGWETTIYNHHRLLWDYPGTTGVKNGYVSQSGYTLVTTAERDDQQLIAVTLNAPGASFSYNDTMTLLDYGFEHFKTEKIKAGERFVDSDGKEYELAKDFYFSIPEDELFGISLEEGGVLTVTNHNGEPVAEKHLKFLVPEDDMLVASQEPVSTEKEGKGNIFARWWASLIEWISPAEEEGAFAKST